MVWILRDEQQGSHVPAQRRTVQPMDCKRPSASRSVLRHQWIFDVVQLSKEQPTNGTDTHRRCWREFEAIRTNGVTKIFKVNKS
jgi:hypothetical protein